MSKYVFGVDVGGTTVKIGLFDDQGGILEKWEIKTNTAEEGSHILPDIAESLKAKMREKGLDRESVIGVGMGTPGSVSKDGVAYKAVNLGWDTLDIPEVMGGLMDKMPIRAGNDANVAALGEMWKGGGQGYDNLVLVTLGTGVGSGIIIEGRILTGANGAGGEIGHIHVKDGETQKCNCGNYGCLEQYTSATGIVRLATRKLQSTDRPSSLRGCHLSAKVVLDAVKAGDALAVEVAEQFGEILGKALSVTAGIVNPECFVIGGGVSRAGNILFDYIVPYYNETVFIGCQKAEFILATLGNDAGIYGAAKLILDYESGRS